MCAFLFLTFFVIDAILLHEGFLIQLGKTETYCQRVNSELVKRLSEERVNAHKRYLNAYGLIMRKDRELGEAFNDCRRSTAVMQIRIIHALGVIRADELARFSESTRNFILAEF